MKTAIRARKRLFICMAAFNRASARKFLSATENGLHIINTAANSLGLDSAALACQAAGNPTQKAEAATILCSLNGLFCRSARRYCGAFQKLFTSES
jgi:hypothetical protein